MVASEVLGPGDAADKAEAFGHFVMRGAFARRAHSRALFHIQPRLMSNAGRHFITEAGPAETAGFGSIPPTGSPGIGLTLPFCERAWLRASSPRASPSRRSRGSRSRARRARERAARSG